MSIILCLGNIGSGKTATLVRHMVKNPQRLKFYANITPTKPKETPQIIPIDSSMIIHKELEKTIQKRDGTSEDKFKFTLNKDFWQNINEPISVVLDEIHTIMNARRGQSKVNVIMSDFLSLLRRVLGEDPLIQGDLFLITQLGRRSDVILREMAHQVRYHVCRYTRVCVNCYLSWNETSEDPEHLYVCPRCQGYKLQKINHKIEVWHFAGIKNFDMWKEWGQNTFHRHYIVKDIVDYFPYYNTTQWEGLFSDLY